MRTVPMSWPILVRITSGKCVDMNIVWPPFNAMVLSLVEGCLLMPQYAPSPGVPMKLQS